MLGWQSIRVDAGIRDSAGTLVVERGPKLPAELLGCSLHTSS